MRFFQYVPPALLLGYAAAANTAEASVVIPLTSATFDGMANAEPLMLVAFVSPTSAHYDALMPEYENAAKVLIDTLRIMSIIVDCVDQAELCAKHHVVDLPSLVVFRHGKLIASYDGPLKGDRIFAFMVTLPVPAVIEVTAANHEAVKASADAVFIAYGSSPTDASAAVFSQVAERQRNDGLVHGLCTDEGVIAAAGVTPPAVVAYRQFDEPQVVFTPADFGAAELEDFIFKSSLPLVGHVGAVGYFRYRKTGLPLAFLFAERGDPGYSQYVAALRPVAEKYRGQLAVGHTGSRRYAEAFGLSGDTGSWPAFAIQQRDGTRLYRLTGDDLSADVLTDFVDRFAAGALAPEGAGLQDDSSYAPGLSASTACWLALNSAPVPAAASQGTNVYEVVGAEFDAVVFDDAKDVFLEVYTTRGCPHCKRLTPTWDLLGDKYAVLNDRITIARVEATKNDLPFSVAGVPWLRFKKAGTREFVDFEGDRTLEALVKFVETHAANPLSSEIVQSSEEDAQRGFHGYKS